MSNEDKVGKESLEYMYELGSERSENIEFNGRNYLVLKSGARIETLEEHEESPRFLKTSHTFTSPDSFIEYFNRFASEHSTIFINREGPSMTAVFDYHEGEGKPKWGNHRAHLSLSLSQEWKDWKEKQDKGQSQEEFAYFIEDHAQNFIVPESAQMMEIALEMNAKNNVEFEQISRLNNGSNTFSYRESIDATTKGDMEIPSDLEIALKVFEGINQTEEVDGEIVSKAVRYQIGGKFRFSLREKKLYLRYKLLNLDVIYDHAVDKLVNFVKGKIIKGNVYEGKQ